VSLDRCRFDVSPPLAATVGVPRRPRLAYRDVASAGNRLTLIAAIVPARAVTTHTLFCLRRPLPLPAQQVLGALLNSFVANYLIRMRVTTHVSATLMALLPVPLLVPAEPAFDRLAHLSVALQRGRSPVEAMPEYAELQALAALLYGLRRDEFEHILATFPLIPSAVRDAALDDFTRLHSSWATEARRHGGS